MSLLVDIEDFDKKLYDEKYQLLKKLISPFLNEDDLEEYEVIENDSLVNPKTTKDSLDSITN